VSQSTTRVVAAESPDQYLAPEVRTPERAAPPAPISRYVLLGVAATALLSLIEGVDVILQLTPIFSSASERLIFIAYFSVNLLSGALIGWLVGVFVRGATLVKRHAQDILAHRTKLRRRHKLAAMFLVAAALAILLNQQPQIRGFAISLLREAEKFPHLGRPLHANETRLSYLVVMGLAISAALVWMMTNWSARWSRLGRSAWMIGLALVIGVAYAIDSRVEVQQYEYSMHRLMWLVAMTAAMALVATVRLALARPISSSLVKQIGAFTVFIIVGTAVVFTFLDFDKHQDFKTQIFYRTTQAKQHFKFLQWILDFDRDGYSPLLGGGDQADSNPAINPGAGDTIDDGTDNNAIGGDLTEQAMADWQAEFAPLRVAANPEPKRFNIIYFFIDTLRADHLGTYGYARKVSPNIDKLAARASVFENAYSPSPYTYESAPKFMQSAYWDGHFETWTEAMGKSGYHTILFPRRVTMLLRHVKGMEQVVDASRKGLRQTIDAALDELPKVPPDKPFCAYIYSSDPHRPYRPHEGIHYGSTVVDQYDGEITYLDNHLGRLFDWLEQSGHINDTMVVIMSDHGESFGERMVYKHNSQVYDEQMRVPIIFYVPGQAPRRITDYVSTVDLGATILNLVGLESAKETQGVSLLPLMRGEPFTHPPIYGEHSIIEESPYFGSEAAVQPETHKYMVVTQDGFKLIYNRNYYNFELYNLKDDPQELRNLFDRMPAKAAAMKQLLGRFVDVVTAKRPWDADEHKFYFGVGDDEEDKK
jgi:arylsulfatase A-like enzyme